MAKGAAKSKGHKPRSEKRKKEEKVIPTVLDIVVNVPGGKQILLKGISTDRIWDVRRLLAVHVDTCHFTNFSLAHEVRGPHLRDSVDVVALKPCVLDLVQEEYTEASAKAHIRRLLDIVSCTAAFGPSTKQREEAEAAAAAEAEAEAAAAAAVSPSVSAAAAASAPTSATPHQGSNAGSAATEPANPGGTDTALAPIHEPDPEASSSVAEFGKVLGLGDVGSFLKKKPGEAARARGQAGASVEAGGRPAGGKHVDGAESAQKLGKELGEVGKEAGIEAGKDLFVTGADGKRRFKGKREAVEAMAAAAAATEKGDMTGMFPEESKLGEFYEFLSAAYLTPPIQAIRRSLRGSAKGKGAEKSSAQDMPDVGAELFPIEVRLCTGKTVLVVATTQGFLCARNRLHAPTLLALLRLMSKPFAKAYDDLLALFLERNKLGNTPYGFRSNTWVVPPLAAASPSVFPQLPMEDGAWGGNGGGYGRQEEQEREETDLCAARDGAVAGRDWARDLAVLSLLPCDTPEERVVRDRKAFLLHSLFVDTATRQAVSAINTAAAAAASGGLAAAAGADAVTPAEAVLLVRASAEPGSSGSVAVAEVGVLLVQQQGAMRVTVMKGEEDPSGKVLSKVEVGWRRVAEGEREGEKERMAMKSLLKGISADESTAVHDLESLGTVIVHLQGLTARVTVPDAPARAQQLQAQLQALRERKAGRDGKEGDGDSGAEGHGKEGRTGETAEDGDKRGAGERYGGLGACWVQHLQNPPKAEGTSVENGEKKGTEGGGQEKDDGVKAGSGGKEGEAEGEESGGAVAAPGAVAAAATAANASTADANPSASTTGVAVLATAGAGEGEAAGGMQEEPLTAGRQQGELQQLLGESKYEKLKKADVGLHAMTVQELKQGARDFYRNTALSKLVSDFASLELSPVDGRTLTDFMHTRGLRMRSLGKVAALADKLPHVRSLAVHEMVARALKHVIQAVVTTTALSTAATAPAAAGAAGGAGAGAGAGASHSLLAASIAATFNAIFGSSMHKKGEGRGGGEAETSLGGMVWRWVRVFARVRFGFHLDDEALAGLRMLSLLRALCLKAGIEIAPKSYDFNSPTPFQATDIVSMVPVLKHVLCTSADGRTLLEASKAALDKGKLDEAVSCGTKALTKLIAVCGAYHRMTAGAYSLLAVVLYHTGDFNQATIYQQRALDINERELGLDHPDTMKSYGDLAVFYYRLQHTKLAIRYVQRALYLLHLTCGSEHPNSAATYINMAMMLHGLSHLALALRYLHRALRCNHRLLGPDHIQTAASYHAIAIALSLMDAYALSVQHEQTTLNILQARLGPDDLRTLDAAAWLEYFESKAAEQQEAARTGTPKPDATIASKGHLSVSDLLSFINDEEQGRREVIQEIMRKRGRRPLLKPKSNGLLAAAPHSTATGGEASAEKTSSGLVEASTAEAAATGGANNEVSDTVTAPAAVEAGVPAGIAPAQADTGSRPLSDAAAAAAAAAGSGVAVGGAPTIPAGPAAPVYMPMHMPVHMPLGVPVLGGMPLGMSVPVGAPVPLPVPNALPVVMASASADASASPSAPAAPSPANSDAKLMLSGDDFPPLPSSAAPAPAPSGAAAASEVSDSAANTDPAALVAHSDASADSAAPEEAPEAATTPEQAPEAATAPEEAPEA
ncbi:unnamed protein product, partial [Closterium sp. Yama58-4]